MAGKRVVWASWPVSIEVEVSHCDYRSRIVAAHLASDKVQNSRLLKRIPSFDSCMLSMVDFRAYFVQSRDLKLVAKQTTNQTTKHTKSQANFIVITDHIQERW